MVIDGQIYCNRCYLNVTGQLRYHAIIPLNYGAVSSGWDYKGPTNEFDICPDCGAYIMQLAKPV